MTKKYDAGKYEAGFLTLALCLLATCFPGVSFGDSSVEKFFGKYVGRSISVQGEGLSDRDLDVTISAYEENGFTLEWKTVIRYTSRKAKERSSAVNFLPFSKRPGIYYSAMKKDIFGHQAPADPLSGDPYLWAGIEGDTLTVTALYVIEDGGYELQLFRRILTPTGMDTYFERIRNGEKLRIITGKLEKVESAG